MAQLARKLRVEASLECSAEASPGIFIPLANSHCHCYPRFHVRATGLNQKERVIVPANCVDTYDLPVAVAKQFGAVPHDGEFLHPIFLHHMMLKGLEVVSEIV